MPGPELQTGERVRWIDEQDWTVLRAHVGAADANWAALPLHDCRNFKNLQLCAELRGGAGSSCIMQVELERSADGRQRVDGGRSTMRWGMTTDTIATESRCLLNVRGWFVRVFVLQISGGAQLSVWAKGTDQ